MSGSQPFWAPSFRCSSDHSLSFPQMLIPLSKCNSCALTLLRFEEKQTESQLLVNKCNISHKCFYLLKVFTVSVHWLLSIFWAVWPDSYSLEDLQQPFYLFIFKLCIAFLFSTWSGIFHYYIE